MIAGVQTKKLVVDLSKVRPKNIDATNDQWNLRHLGKRPVDKVWFTLMATIHPYAIDLQCGM